MATGDVTISNKFALDIGNERHDLDSQAFKFALITNAITPLATDVSPHFNGIGSTDYSTAEVTPGGNYVAGGIAMSGLTYADNSGTLEWKADKILIAQDGSNPNNARWGVIYNDSNANKRVVATCDLGSVLDLTLGPFEFRFNSVDGNGIVITLSPNA